MSRRFARIAVLALAAWVAAATLVAGGTAAQTSFRFKLKNCDLYRTTLDVRVFDGADLVAFGQQADHHCIPGPAGEMRGCQVKIVRQGDDLGFCVDQDACFLTHLESWPSQFSHCTC